MSLFSAFKKKEQPVVKQEEKPIIILAMRKYPSSIDGHPLQYHYELDIEPVDGVNIIKDILVDCEKIADVSLADGKICLSLNGFAFGYLNDEKKAKMVSDFQKKDFPVNAIIRKDGVHASLRFYRDRRVGAERREQEVVELTAYKGKARQEEIELLSPGDELTIEEENGQAFVYSSETIGKLPAKIAKRYADDNLYGVWVEDIKEEETGDGDIIYVPYVRIYW